MYNLIASSTPTAIGWSDLSDVLTAITGQISVTTVIGVVAGAIGAAIGLVFMWWGVRKLIHVLMAAFRKGKLSS